MTSDLGVCLYFTCQHAGHSRAGLSWERPLSLITAYHYLDEVYWITSVKQLFWKEVILKLNKIKDFNTA